MANTFNAITTGTGGIATAGDSSGDFSFTKDGSAVLNITATSGQPRITGDFSNATFSNRVAFQTTTSNSGTLFNVLPNGTSASASYDAYNSSDMNNSLRARFGVNATEYYINGNVQGTGTYLPFNIYTSNTERMRITTNGGVAFGGAANYGTSGQVLKSNGDAAPTWGTSSPDTTLYAIGSFISGRPANLTTYNVNDTIAGSILYSTTLSGALWSGSWGSYGGQPNATLVNTGTWRCITGTGASAGGIIAVGLWVRIS